MRLHIKKLRWILLGLYLILVLTLLTLGSLGKSPNWFYLPNELYLKPILLLQVVLITILSQLFFIKTAGTIELCKPIRKRRLIWPVLMTGLMLSVLFVGILLTFDELFEMKLNWTDQILLGIMVFVWLLWSLIFFLRYQRLERLKIIRRMIKVMLGGSLLELLIAVPSHVIVSRRPGCFVGIGTSMGISAGILVMLWAFGPGIILLFIENRQKDKP